MKRFFTILFSLVTFLATGQLKPGVITLDNQVIAGFIEVTSAENASRVCRFKETASSEIVEYSPQQIASYQVVGANPYFSGAIDDSGEIKYFFFEQLVAGKLNLYAFNKRLVINSASQPFTELNDTNYKKLLAPHLAECNYANTRLRRLSFDKVQITKIIRAFNQCMQSANPETYSPPKAITTRYGLFLGIDAASVTFDNSTALPTFSGQSFSNLKPFNIGMEVWSNLSALPDRLRIILGVNFAQRRFNAVTTSSGTDYVNNLYFSEFQFPIRLQYTFFQKRNFAGFVSLGSAISIVTGFDSSQIWDTKSGNTIYINEIAPFTSLDKGMGLYAGIGGSIELSKQRKIVISCSYASCPGRFVDGINPPLNANFGTLSLSSGFLF